MELRPAANVGKFSGAELEARAAATHAI